MDSNVNIEIGKRLKAARIAAGLSQEKLADKANLSSRITIIRYEKGDGITLPVLTKIEKALGLPAGSLLSDGEAVSQIAIVGEVGAGAEIFPIDDHHKGAAMEYVDAPPGWNGREYVAVRVRGDSMYPRFHDGDVIIYTRNCHFDPAHLNRECIVRLEDGRTFVKVIRRGSQPGLFHLESYNSPFIHDVKIEWACPISMILPR